MSYAPLMLVAPDDTDLDIPQAPPATALGLTEDPLDQIQTACSIFFRLRNQPKRTTQAVKEMIAAAQVIIDVSAGPMAQAQMLRTQMLRDLGVVEEISEAA